MRLELVLPRRSGSATDRRSGGGTAANMAPRKIKPALTEGGIAADPIP